ncbi:MAG: hypothetical protein BWY68_00771 [bacterium ADurb.Bin400]|nr:MAG: hypothetical protein BWY68_00771 [bacterium ADurb.Bin400]
MNDNPFSESIKTIIESDIFEYLELGALSDEEKTNMMENLIMALRSRIMLKIADLLEWQNPTLLEEFKALLNSDEAIEEDIHQFLTSNKINIDAITAEEAIILKAEVMGLKRNSTRR